MTNRVLAPRVPGSEHIPFKPFNPHGKAPVVTRKDGTVIDWKSPLREPLFQVFVDDQERGRIAIGPQIGMAIADQAASACRLAIKAGRISGWSNVSVERVPDIRPAITV